MALIFGWGILASVVTWAFCFPIAYAWDPAIPGGHCANRKAGNLVVGTVDAITDFLILILPIPVIWNLQIPRARQVSLIFIFSIAILSMIASAIRAYYTTLVNFHDFTNTRTRLDVFSAIEPATSIIVASSLVLGPVLKKWFSEGFHSHSIPSPHSFRRIEEDKNKFAQGDIELSQTETAVHGPGKTEQPTNGEAGSENGARGTVGIDAHRRVGLEFDGIAVKREVLVQREV